MAAAGTAVRTLVCLFGCVGFSGFVYVFVMDRYSSCFDLKNRWLMVEDLSFFINLGVIATWVFYKESSWIVAAILTVLLTVFASVATCLYIITQFLKLSPEEFSKDPLYFVLVTRNNRDVNGHKKGLSVVTVKVIFSALGCLVLGSFIYLLIVDGSPFHANVFSSCMIGTLLDFYATVAVLSLWVAYKESSWINAFLWILLLVCFGGAPVVLFAASATCFRYNLQQHSQRFVVK
ncbi:hypothetical protein L1987_55348 [Smallanthus sonchifolius]|uniref:Uncharacterized protein n=1 Tax=Smallanthus sonchifolius TaxID=185202 RepID=A0ACB9EA27_9ASTR|nr:hypothetical protein L1987_55348 [Smallanthus sonchifolius]